MPKLRGGTRLLGNGCRIRRRGRSLHRLFAEGIPDFLETVHIVLLRANKRSRKMVGLQEVTDSPHAGLSAVCS